MKKLFISQPMKGKTEEEIKEERYGAISLAKSMLNEGVQVIDSYFEDFDPVGNVPLAYLGKSISLLATADVAYFAPGWELARGCKIEHECAVKYGIRVIY